MTNIPLKCPYCGSRFFKIVKNEKDEPESIKVVDIGVYKINVKNFLNEKMRIVSLKEGIYKIVITD